MNARALQVVDNDIKYGDTCHTLRVIQANAEVKTNPARWDINDHTPIGIVRHHWLDSGTWWYRLGIFNSQLTTDLSESDLLALIEYTQTLPESRENGHLSGFAPAKPPTHQIAIGRCSTLVIHERDDSPWISTTVEMREGGYKTFRRQLHPTTIIHERRPEREKKEHSPELLKWLNRGKVPGKEEQCLSA